jgi:hypothetical protein
MQTVSLEHESRSEVRSAAPRYGAMTGLALAAILLAWAAFALVMAEGSTVKAAVAVWLWTLPVLGIGSGAGWLAGRAIQRIGGR